MLALPDEIEFHARTSTRLLDEGGRQLGALEMLSSLDPSGPSLVVHLLSADLRFEPGEWVARVEGPILATFVPLPLQAERAAVLCSAEFSTSRGHAYTALVSAHLPGECQSPAVQVTLDGVRLGRGKGTLSLAARGQVVSLSPE